MALHRQLIMLSRLTCNLLRPSASCLHVDNVRGAKKAAGKMGAPVQKVRLPVETDPRKLVTHCCGANIYIEGEDPKLKPASEYPDWLWSLRLDRRPPDISELDPEEDYYWWRLRRMAMRNKIRMIRSSPKKK